MTTLADLIDEVVGGYRSPVVSAIASQPRASLPQAAQALRANMSAAKAGPPSSAPMAVHPEYQFLEQTLAPALGTGMDILGLREPQPGYNRAQQITSDVLAPTGLPQIGRGVGHTLRSIQLRDQPQASADEAGAAIPEIAMGGLNLMGTLGGGDAMLPRLPARRLPVADVAEPVTRLPVNPTRELGPNAMPIASAQPFRNSLRGGSADLSEAAAMRGNDGGHLREMPVADLRARIDPFGAVNPWDERMAPITMADVRRAVRRGTSEGESFSHPSNPQREWTRQDHINRIAELVRNPSAEPINIAERGGVHDGVHRLAAAIIHGDETLPIRQMGEGYLGHGDTPVQIDPNRLHVEFDGGRWHVRENSQTLQTLPVGSRVNDAQAALANLRRARGEPQSAHNVGQSREAPPIRTVTEDLDPEQRAYEFPLDANRTARVEIYKSGNVFWSVKDASTGSGQLDYELTPAARQRIGRSVIRGVQEVLAHDAATHAPTAYKFAGVSDAHNRLYESLMRSAEQYGYSGARNGRSFILRRNLNSTNTSGAAAIPLGIGLGGALIQSRQRRSRRPQSRKLTQPPSGGFFMEAH